MEFASDLFRVKGTAEEMAKCVVIGKAQSLIILLEAVLASL